VLIHDAAQLRALGERLGLTAFPGAILALTGDLAAGKTTLTQGLGEGLGHDDVSSPTFVLMQQHVGGRLDLYHTDFYRVEREQELVQLGIDDWMGGDGVTVVEWADRFPDALPPDHLALHLEVEAAGRRIVAAPRGAAHAAWWAEVTGG
jgi:tRNA threonylcarbamoyladenosine biosynthesis protein TsaE